MSRLIAMLNAHNAHCDGEFNCMHSNHTFLSNYRNNIENISLMEINDDNVEKECNKQPNLVHANI